MFIVENSCLHVAWECYIYVGLATIWLCYVAWVEVATVLPPYTGRACISAVPPLCDVDVPVLGVLSDSNETGILV